MYKDLDPLLHSQLRLALMSLLISVKEVDFVSLKGKMDATSGDLSIQFEKLNEAGYITVEKQFKGKRLQILCQVTQK